MELFRHSLTGTTSRIENDSYWGLCLMLQWLYNQLWFKKKFHLPPNRHIWRSYKEDDVGYWQLKKRPIVAYMLKEPLEKSNNTTFLTKKSCKHAWCPKWTVVGVSYAHKFLTIQVFQTLFKKTLLWKLCCYLCVWSLKSRSNKNKTMLCFGNFVTFFKISELLL